VPINTQGLDEAESRQRKLTLGVLGVMIIVLFGLVFSQTWFNLTFIKPDNTQQTLVFAALSTLIFLLFLALSFVLLRNLLKLYAQRRIGVLGSRFRTKMVVGALLLSFVPVLFLFLFAYGLMNRSIDKWFSYPAEQLRQDSTELASLLTRYASINAAAEATAIAGSSAAEHAYGIGYFGELAGEIKRHESTLQGGFVIALKQDEVVASYQAPQSWSELTNALPPRQGGARARTLKVGGKDYVIGDAPAGENGRILVAMPLPDSLNTLLTRIAENQKRYGDLSSNRKSVQRMYVMLLSLLTMLTLFVATWISLYISKFVTQSVSALAEAMEEISQGHFSYRVELEGSDELGELVTSFNSMAADLEISRAQVEASGRQLEIAKGTQEERRRQLEAVLENIPSGVLSLDPNYRVTHFNRAFAKLFPRQLADQEALDPGTSIGLPELFGAEAANDLRRMLRKSDRMGVTAGQFEMAGSSMALDVAVTVASLNTAKQRLGYVMVLEDFTELLKAQKQAAWREVARRVAHEIKNPLTPIALSAERIRKHLDRSPAAEGNSAAIIRSCAETISSSVSTVRNLVDEFSALAQFPSSLPRPSGINAIVEGALSLFQGRLEGIRIRLKLGIDLPAVLADPEALKRALANLIDNAAESMRESLHREIAISTGLVEGRDMIEVVVADTGHGVTREMKEKLFLPYFSTKQRGTGLGLTIVSKILQEHQGAVRVEENEPLGARFVLELPLAAEAATLVVATEALR